MAMTFVGFLLQDTDDLINIDNVGKLP